MMTHTTTVDLTRGELSILATSLEREWQRTSKLWTDGNRDGWYDEKAKERVAVHLHETERLFNKVNTRIKEMDNG
jgi:hypothetical protein